MDTLTELQQAFPWLIAGWAFVFGACIGSFLNVVILRWPKGQSLGGRSYCACGTMIAWHDNLPILGWLMLRGRARCCGRPFSVRYPLIEALTGALFAAAWWQYPPILAAIICLFIAIMVVVAMIDLDTMFISDHLSVGGFLLGISLSVLVPALHVTASSGVDWIDRVQSFLWALFGAGFGTALLMWIAAVTGYALQKDAMGEGDYRLIGAIGAFCGWQGCVSAIFGGSLLALVGLIGYLAYRAVFTSRGSADQSARQAEEAAPSPSAPTEATEDDALPEDGALRLPFGPALVGGALLYLLVWREPFDAQMAEVADLVIALMR